MWVLNDSFSSCIMPPTFSNPCGLDLRVSCVADQHFLLLETLELGFRNTRPLLFSSFLSAFHHCFLFSPCFLTVNTFTLPLQPLIFSSYFPRAILRVLPMTCIMMKCSSSSLLTCPSYLLSPCLSELQCNPSKA